MTQSHKPVPSSDSPLSSEDHHLWERVKKLTVPLLKANSEKSILSKTVMGSASKPTQKNLVKKTSSENKHSRSAHSKPPLKPFPKNKIQRKCFKVHNHTLRKIAQRSFEFSALLDLHGQNLDAAYQNYTAFIQDNYRLQKRFLLVITGKGSGTLRSAFMNWCQDDPLSHHVLSFSQAASFHGGAGAFYVVLKKIQTDQHNAPTEHHFE